jgi:RNA polymerase sigma-70 factor (ECF subfamily)
LEHISICGKNTIEETKEGNMDKTDPELVSAYLESGDVHSFETLVDRHAPTLYRIAFRMTRNHHEAEDICQEAFLVILRRLADFRKEGSFRAWAAGIVWNTGLHTLRAKRRRDEGVKGMKAVVEQRTGEGIEPTAGIEREELANLVEEHLWQLPPDNRIPLVLHFIEGFTYGEVGKALNIPEGTVKSRIGRGLDKVRDDLMRTGHSVVVAAIPPLLKGVPLPEVPPGLLPALKAMPVKIALPSGIASRISSVLGRTGPKSKLGLAGILVLIFLGVGIAFCGSRLKSWPFRSPGESGEGLAKGERSGGGRPGPSPSSGKDAKKGPDGSGSISDSAGPGNEAEGQEAAPGNENPGKPVDRVGSTEPVWVKIGRKKSKRSSTPGEGNPCLDGKVVDSESVPVPEADVYFMRVGKWRSLTRKARTDENGEFSAFGLAAGEYLVLPDFRNLLETEKGLDVSEAKKIDLRPGVPVRGLLFRLPFAMSDLGSLEGLVLDKNSRPIARARIQVGFYRTTSDLEGKFRIPALLPGLAVISAFSYGFGKKETRIVVQNQEDRGGVVITLEPEKYGEITLSGSVKDGLGDPVPLAEISVQAGNPMGRILRKGGTDESGYFCFDHLGCGEVYLCVFKPGYTSVGKTIDLSGNTISNIVLVRHATISGIVKSKRDGEPIRKFTVSIHQKRGVRIYQEKPEPRCGYCSPETTGVFKVWCIPGEVLLKVEASGYKTHRSTFTLAKEGERLENLVIELDEDKE